KSEYLSQQLKKRGIKHEVLNAKQHEREAAIVADAGRKGAVTVATNMAGRGTDIMLGGNSEFRAVAELKRLGLDPHETPEDYEAAWDEALAKAEQAVAAEHEEVTELGGLYVLGTERHESRRIDNQLRGRAGRQGDPGESRFFLSAEDDLIRLFAGDRIYKILDRLGSLDPDGNEEPIEAKLLTKQIEKAQRKVEEQNFLQRKRVLEYDDVMNEQRRVVYALRDQVLEGGDMAAAARDEIAGVIERTVSDHTAGDFIEDWDLEGLFVVLEQIYPVSFTAAELERDRVDREGLVRMFVEDAAKLYAAREAELGEELMRSLERYLVLQVIDERWREHLYDMDYLREGIGLRGLAQIDPLVAYKNEAFDLFADLMTTIWSDFARLIFHVEVQLEAPNGGEPPPPPIPQYTPGGNSTRAASVSYSSGATAAPGAVAAAAVVEEAAEEVMPPVEQRRVATEDQVGRNDPCWCGSGKKFKRCHGA
ncbi:MAG: SEC-C metal-binding domain-containing protein, partial [Gaiellales bacterium]